MLPEPSCPPTITTDTLSSCPAFSNGCPFRGIKTPGTVVSPEMKGRETAEHCPAFGDGCAFKNARSIADLEAMLSRIPATHLIGGKTFGSSESLRAILKAIHEHSLTTSEREGLNNCPVFKSSCPFKNVTSGGSPLVTELEYRTWSIVDNLAIVEHDDAVDGAADDGTLDNDGVEPEDNRSSQAGPQDTADPTVQLATELKMGTKKSHRAAENVQFVRNFLRGRVDRDLYKHMLISLWHTYTALEDELRKNAENPTYEKLHFPVELERKESLEADLDFFFGENWREDPDVMEGPTACTQEYVSRIRQIGAEAPELLVAHAYTRYLGDLSGGQVLKRVAIKAMGLPDNGMGTQFYDFEAIPSAKAFKEEYRRRMDDTEVDAVMADRIVAEANLAFVLNMRVFEELDVMGCHAERVRPLDEVLATLDMPVDAKQKCPFSTMGGPNPHSAAPQMSATTTTTAGASCPIPQDAVGAVKRWAPVVLSAVAAAGMAALMQRMSSEE